MEGSRPAIIRAAGAPIFSEIAIATRIRSSQVERVFLRVSFNRHVSQATAQSPVSVLQLDQPNAVDQIQQKVRSEAIPHSMYSIRY